MRRRRLYGTLPLLFGTVALTAAFSESTPVVGLNHLTLIPDSATFAAIATSAFLRDTFALVDRSPEGEPERIALFGRSTYIEFRRPAETSMAWTSGVALGTDVRGALSTVAQRLTSEVGPVHIDSVSRRRDSIDVPWLYRLASDTGADSTLALRIVEYHPQFVSRWFGASTPATVARADVLAMHATGAGTARRFAFVDVVAIKIAAAPETAAMVIAHCRAVGWRVRPAASGKACVGPDVRLFVVASQHAERGIVAFTMQIKQNVNARSPASRRIGNSILRVSKTGLATWQFGPGA